MLQALARHNLIDRFHYLSTVSGGGYIGGWLSGWLLREGGASVAGQIGAPASSPLEVEPAPVSHLRAFGNYLSPKLGLLSADTWTLIGTYLRNLF